MRGEGGRGGGRRGRPRWPGLAAGRGVQLRPLQRGPADPTGCGNPAWLLRERPLPAPALRTEIVLLALGLRRSWAEAVRWCRGGWCRSPSHSHFHQDLKCFSPFESWESKGKGGEKGVRGARGMGSLTQSNDLRGVEQMVPLTSAAERTRLSGPRLGP